MKEERTCGAAQTRPPGEYLGNGEEEEEEERCLEWVGWWGGCVRRAVAREEGSLERGVEHEGETGTLNRVKLTRTYGPFYHRRHPPHPATMTDTENMEGC